MHSKKRLIKIVFPMLTYLSAIVMGLLFAHDYAKSKAENSQDVAPNMGFTETEVEKDENFALYESCTDSIVYRVRSNYSWSERMDENKTEGLGFFILTAHRYNNEAAYFFAMESLINSLSNKFEYKSELIQDIILKFRNQLEDIEKFDQIYLLSEKNKLKGFYGKLE